MLRTRVGYAGGTTPSPTYHSIGDHSEAIEIDFDPKVLNYDELVSILPEELAAKLRLSADELRSLVVHKLVERAQKSIALRRGGEELSYELDLGSNTWRAGGTNLEAKSFAEARGALRPLFRDWRGELTPAALAETAKLLLFSSLSAAQAEGPAAASRDAATPNQVVDWFEILKERQPELFVSFDDTMLVAAAYESIGEFDRATSLFRAVIDETFGEDMRVAAALETVNSASQERAPLFAGGSL